MNRPSLKPLRLRSCYHRLDVNMDMGDIMLALHPLLDIVADAMALHETQSRIDQHNDIHQHQASMQPGLHLANRPHAFRVSTVFRSRSS